MTDSDIRHLLEITINEAKKAFDEGNYPIGSLIIDSNGNILSQKRNQSFTNKDVSAHAEILNLREIGTENKENLLLFSSLEPCFGCSFFIARSPIFKNLFSVKRPS